MHYEMHGLFYIITCSESFFVNILQWDGVTAVCIVDFKISANWCKGKYFIRILECDSVSFINCFIWI